MRITYLPLLLVSALSCQPKETAEVVTSSTTIADTLSLKETLDSTDNANQDGTLTVTGPSQDVKQQLPPELEVLLDQTHGLWQILQVQDSINAQLSQNQQGPYFLQTDINADKKVDYVVQIAEGETVTVYAFIRPTTETQPWQESVIERKKVLPLNGKRQSPYLLTLLEEGKDTTANKKVGAGKKKGILIKEGAVTSLYLWQNGKWEKSQPRLDQ